MASGIETCPTCNKVYATSHGACPYCRNAHVGRGFIGVAIIGGGLFLLVKIIGSAPAPPAPATAPPPPAAQAQEKPDRSDLLEDADFRKKNPKFIDGVRQLISASGYECAALTFLWLKGDSPYGPKLEALCGPSDGSHDTIPSQHYAIYPSHFKVNVCKEFSAFGPDCE